MVLTGVDITSYGRDLPGAPKLGTLVKSILRHVPELERLRLSSIDSVEADDDLLDAIADEPRLMPHLHLSLQAGDDMILKRMKRRHSRADAIALLRRGAAAAARHGVRRRHHRRLSDRDRGDVRRARLDLVEECGLTHLHVFPFSPRPGTPAARMPQVAREVVKERARRLRDRGEAALRAASRGRGRRAATGADREPTARPHRRFHAGALPGAGACRRDPRGRDRRT